MNLTDEQKAILKETGSMIVVANAGTGKTTTLIEKVKRDLPLIKSDQCLVCVTFTNLAADDIKARFRETNGIIISTIDSFIISLINEIFYYADEGIYVCPDYGQVFDTFREGAELIKAKHLIGIYKNPENNFACQYLKRILERNLDIAESVAEWYPRFYIDEYQDVDKDMHALFLMMHDKLGIQFVMIGDPKQSLYGWRGAHPEYMVALSRRTDFSYKRLTKNFRSTDDIVNYSNILFDSGTAMHAAGNSNPRDIIFLPIRDFWDWGRDAVSRFDLDKQITLLRYKNHDVAVGAREINRAGLSCPRIYRPAIFNMAIENKAFYLAAATFAIDTKTSFDKFIGPFAYRLKDAANLSKLEKYAQILRKAASKSEFYKIVKTLAAYLNIETDESALAALYSTVKSADDCAYFLQDQYRYKAMTIHSAKGLEWDQVLLFADDFPLTSVENRCLYYVAVTRARQRVVILCRDYQESQRLKYIQPYHLFP